MTLSRKSLLYRLAYFDGDERMIEWYATKSGKTEWVQRTSTTTCRLFWRLALLPVRVPFVAVIGLFCVICATVELFFEWLCKPVTFTED